MGNPKITSIIVGMLFVSFIMVVFMLGLSEISVNYGVSYDKTDVDVFNKTQELYDIANNVNTQNAVSISEGDASLDNPDILGGIFRQGYKALKLTGSSVNLMGEMTDSAIDSANLGAVGNVLKTVLFASILIIIIIGVFIAAIVKRNL